MKSKNLSASKAEYKRLHERQLKLRSLIEACLERYNEDEIVQAFGYVTDNTYAIKKETEDIIFDLSCNGYAIFKTESFQQADQLREYAENIVFPFYNQQQTAILF